MTDYTIIDVDDTGNAFFGESLISPDDPWSYLRRRISHDQTGRKEMLTHQEIRTQLREVLRFIQDEQDPYARAKAETIIIRLIGQTSMETNPAPTDTDWAALLEGETDIRNMR